MRIVIELDGDEQDLTIRVSRAGAAAEVVRSTGFDAGQALAAPAQFVEDGGTTDAGPAPENID